MDYPHLKLMQTETECGVKDNPSPEAAWHYAELQFGIVRKYLEASVNSYMLWNMVLDSEGKSNTGWLQYAPVTVNRDTRSVEFLPQYYAFTHFSFFVEPGAHRIGFDGSYKDCVCFENPDGSVVVVAQNSTDLPKQLLLNMDGVKVMPTVPTRSWNTFLLPAVR